MAKFVPPTGDDASEPNEEIGMSTSEQSDEALNDDARPNIADWFERYHAQLLRFLTRGLGERTDAQDLAQEVFLRILRVDDPDLIRHPRAYLYRVAVNVIQEWRVRQRRFPTEDDLNLEQELVGDGPEPAELLESSERRQRLNAAINRLPPRYRVVLVLCAIRGMTHKEVAVKLDMTPRMVKRDLIKAYAGLRDDLGGAYNELCKSD